MDADADLAEFLAVYAAICAEAGVAPLPADEPVAVVRMMLAGAIPAAVTLH